MNALVQAKGSAPAKAQQAGADHAQYLTFMLGGDTFALGILERDGLATRVGWFAAIRSVLLLAAISSAIVAGINAFLDQLWVILG